MRCISYLVIFFILSAAAIAAEVPGSDDSGKDVDLVDDKGNKIEILTTSGDTYIVINNRSKGKEDGIGPGNNTKVEVKTQNQGEATEIKVQTREEVKNRVQEIRSEAESMKRQGLENMSPGEKNENTVRAAVHALLAMENLTGGIGRNVSIIARDFNNRQVLTNEVEAKIQERSALKKFFAGGDARTGKRLETIVEQNQDKIQELKKLKEKCDCEEEVKELMQEQIQNMENEQNRLRELALKEQKSRGILGWIWK